MDFSGGGNSISFTEQLNLIFPFGNVAAHEGYVMVQPRLVLISPSLV